MDSFSKRMGYRPVRKKIQFESIDDELRNRLWNALIVFYWDKFPSRLSDKPIYVNFVMNLWDNHFKWSIDGMDDRRFQTLQIIRQYFIFDSSWFQKLDFVEFMAINFPIEEINKQFIEQCNKIFEEESSAYRFVGGRIAPITSEEEIKTIEKAISSPLDPVNIHLKTALDFLSNRKSPEYRNSIKESISAVESICKILTGNKNATLDSCLDLIEKKIGLHPALKRSFSSLYGYTSSAEGIRHGLLDAPTLNLEDAMFMLVSCSAFVNFLVSKASKAGIMPQS